MKKVLFAILAMSVMSTAVYAEGGIKKKVKQHAKKTCPKGCPDSKNCHSTSICFPGCGCC